MSAEAKAGRDLLAGLTERGFDEISIRKGQKYLTVVVDHHSGRLVWAAFGRDRKTVEKFLDLLGEERCKQIRLVSCDDAEWITRPIAERCPQAVICLDPWHIVKAATDALDDVRWAVWNEARRSGNKQLAKQLKGAPVRALEAAGEPDRAPADQARLDPRAQRADLPRLAAQRAAAPDLPRRHRRGRAQAVGRVAEVGPRMPPGAVRQAARRITEQRSRLEAGLRHQLSNARVEQVNTQIRLIVRRGFGYRSPEAVIALAMLSLGGLWPPLPGR